MLVDCEAQRGGNVDLIEEAESEGEHGDAVCRIAAALAGGAAEDDLHLGDDPLGVRDVGTRSISTETMVT